MSRLAIRQLEERILLYFAQTLTHSMVCRSRLISSVEYIEELVSAECARGIDPLHVVIVAEGQSACAAVSAVSR